MCMCTQSKAGNKTKGERTQGEEGQGSTGEARQQGLGFKEAGGQVLQMARRRQPRHLPSSLWERRQPLAAGGRGGGRCLQPGQSLFQLLKGLLPHQLLPAHHPCGEAGEPPRGCLAHLRHLSVLQAGNGSAGQAGRMGE